MALTAHLHIHAGFKDAATYLQSSYCTPPFKIANITENKQQPFLELMVMNASPGVLSNDDFQIKIHLAENACLRLLSQSYQRIFDMQASAKQHTEVQVGNNAHLVYLPHPVVPHANSHFIAETNIHLSEGACLLWGEIITCGRMLHNEVFQMRYFQSRTHIWYNQKRYIADNIIFDPANINPLAVGLLEGYTHQASIFYWNPHIRISEVCADIHNYLSQLCTLPFGVTQLPGYGLLIRILGVKAEKLYQLQQQLGQYVLQQHWYNAVN